MDFWANSVIKTAIVIVAVVVVDLVIEFLLLKRIANKRKRSKAKVITRNVLIVVLLFFLVKIWVEGFLHFLALLGFIAAALTITQKENILNLTGGLVIMWRQTFAEGDYICIANHSGIIRNLGLFYFTVDETLSHGFQEKTGRSVKVPNSFVSLHSFVVYEFDHFVFLDKSYYFTFDTNWGKLETLLCEHLKSCREHLKSIQDTMSAESLKDLKRMQRKQRFHEISFDLSISQSTIHGIKVRVCGHCPAQEEATMMHKLDLLVLDLTKHKDIHLKDDS